MTCSKSKILEAITRQQNQLSEASGAHVFGLTDTFHLSGTNGTHEYIVLPVPGCNLGAQSHRFAEGRIPVRTTKHFTK